MVLGFGRWAVKQALKKDKTKTIKIKPGTKFPGQKTVGQVKLDASLKKLKDVSEDYKDSIRKWGKTVDKATETIKKIKGK